MVVNLKNEAGEKVTFGDAEVEITKPGDTVDGQAKEAIVSNEAEKVEIPFDITHGDGEPANTNAEIEFGLQILIPTGEYQNIRVSVGVKCRCEDDTDVMDAVFAHLAKWTDNKITRVVKEITSPL